MQKVFHFAVAILVFNCEVQAGNNFSSNAMAAAQIAVNTLLAKSDENMEVASFSYNKLAESLAAEFIKKLDVSPIGPTKSLEIVGGVVVAVRDKFKTSDIEEDDCETISAEELEPIFKQMLHKDVYGFGVAGIWRTNQHDIKLSYSRLIVFIIGHALLESFRQAVSTLKISSKAIYAAAYYGAKCTIERKIPEPLPAGISFTAFTGITFFDRSSILYHSMKIANDENAQQLHNGGHYSSRMVSDTAAKEALNAEIAKHTFGFAISENNGIKYVVTAAFHDAAPEDIFTCFDKSSPKLVIKPEQNGGDTPKPYGVLQFRKSEFGCTNSVESKENNRPDLSLPKLGMRSIDNLKAKSNGYNTASNATSDYDRLTASLDTAMELLPRTLLSNSATQDPLRKLKKTTTIGNLTTGIPRRLPIANLENGLELRENESK